MICENCYGDIPPHSTTCPYCDSEVPGKAVRKHSLFPRILAIVLILALLSTSICYIYYTTFRSLFFGHQNVTTVSSSSMEENDSALSLQGLTTKELKKHTVMIYMIGSDLETNYYYATSDIDEMLHAKLGNNINVVIQTGGAKSWHKTELAKNSKDSQRFYIDNQSLVPCGNLGTQNMTDSQTLSDFITFSKTYFPADNYSIIFWSHGCGFPSSFGADDFFPDDVLTIPEIATAMDTSDTHFDLVVFSACIMNTIDAAVSLSPYADYLVASEDYMWGPFILEYKYFLTKMENNPDMDIPSIAKILIDDYMYALNRTNQDYNVELHGDLSLIDLSKIPAVFSNLETFIADAHKRLLDGDLLYLVKARNKSKEFAASGNGGYGIDTIDLFDFAGNASEIAGSEALQTSIRDAVLYTNTNTEGTNGIGFYFPSRFLYGFDDVGYKNLQEFGFSEDYLSFFKDYASLISYSNGLNSSNSIDIFFSEFKNADYTQSPWMNNSLIASYGPILEQYQLTLPPVQPYEDTYALTVSEEQASYISSVQLGVTVDDEDGYYNLGVSDFGWYFEDSDEDPSNGRTYVYDYSKYWYYFEDHVVSYTFLDSSFDEDNNQYYYGLVPARLNDDTDVNLLVYSDSYTPSGVVVGYIPINADQNSLNYSAILDLQTGDRIDFLLQTKTSPEEDWEWTTVGDTYVYDDNYLFFDTYDISDCGNFSYSYIITDIYGNNHEVGWYNESTSEITSK